MLGGFLSAAREEIGCRIQVEGSADGLWAIPRDEVFCFEYGTKTEM